MAFNTNISNLPATAEDAPAGYDGTTVENLIVLQNAYEKDPKSLTKEQLATLSQFDDGVAKQQASIGTEGSIGGSKDEEKIVVPTVDSFDKNKYSTDKTCYPSDLLTNPKFGKNYIIYFINEYDGITTKGGNNSVPANMGIYKQSGDVASKNPAEQTAANVGGTATAAVGVTEVLTGNKVKGLATLVAAGAITLFGADALSALGGLGVAGATRKRLKTAIALPVPNDASFSDSWSWAEQDSLKSAAINAAVNALASGDDGALKNLGMKSGVAAAVAMIASKSPSLAAQTRQAINPKQEVLFSGVGYRTFTHSYQFSPRSQQEVDIVDTIIKTFRFAASPDYVDSASFVYVYPSDFDIQYYHGSAQNKYIPKHTSCVLTGITTNFSPNSSYATFDGGAPIMISLTLNFKELATVSKPEIKEGY